MSEDFFKSCPICNSDAIIEFEAASKNFLMQCKNCSFVFVQKIPSAAELMAHYDNYPRGNPISAITIKRYNELLDKLEPHRKTNNMIDVGCGDGYFLAEAKKRNWNVFGTEYTDVAVKICAEKGIKMLQGKLKASDYPAGFFDVLTSFEVIEHINNPREELSNFAALVREGGVVYITTPNFNSASRYYLKNKWNIIEYPEHLSYYTKKTLSYLFAQNNFKPIKFQSTGISLSRFSQSLHVEAPNASDANQDELFRTKTESNFLLMFAKNAVNAVLSLFNAGDTLKGTYRKMK